MMDNDFIGIVDWDKTQKIDEGLAIEIHHKIFEKATLLAGFYN